MGRYRICVIKQGDVVALRTKSNQEPGARYKHIEELISRSKLPACVLDGELVALDPEGLPSFQLLQQSRRNRACIVLYVFDVLNYANRDLRSLRLETRRAVLDAMSSRFPDQLRISELLPDDADTERLVKALGEQKLEGYREQVPADLPDHTTQNHRNIDRSRIDEAAADG